MRIVVSAGALDFAAVAALALLLFGVLAAFLWRLTRERFQRRRQERERMQALDQELNDLLESLRPSLQLPDTIDLNGAEGSRPPAAEAAIRIIDARFPAENVLVEQSFAGYRELTRRRAVLDALIELRRTDRAFSEAGRRLDRHVTGLISDHNALRRIDPLHDRLETAYLFGRIHGVPEAELLARIGIPDALVAVVQERAAEIASDDQVATLARQYVAAREHLMAAVNGLGSLLGSRPVLPARPQGSE